MKVPTIFLKKRLYFLFFILVFLLLIYIVQCFLEVEERATLDNFQGDASIVLTTTMKPFSFKKIIKCYIVRKEESRSLFIFFPIFIADKSPSFLIKWETNTKLIFNYQNGEIYHFANFCYIQKSDIDLREFFIRLEPVWVLH